MTRERRAKRAAELKAQGLNGIQIAKRMRLSRTYTYALLSDPDGSADRERKKQYGGTCEECGAPTDGSNGRALAPKVCTDCLRPPWTREDAIAAVQAFYDDHGRSPVTADRIVWDSTAKRLFGGWNKLLIAAGLPLTCDRRDRTQARMERLLAQGLSATEVAKRMGWKSSANVAMRLRYRGATVESVGGFSPAKQWKRDRQRIFDLYHEGRTYQEIADAVGCTRDGVAMRIFTMRQHGWDLPYRNPGVAAWHHERVAA